MKGFSKGRYDETFAGEDAYLGPTCIQFTLGNLDFTLDNMYFTLVQYRKTCS